MLSHGSMYYFPHTQKQSCDAPRVRQHARKCAQQRLIGRSPTRRTDRPVAWQCARHSHHHTISTFQQPRAPSHRSDRPQTWLKYRALAVRWIPSESARCASWIALNNTKSNLGSFKALKVHVGIPDAHNRRPRWGLAFPSCPCHIGGCLMLHIALQGPGAGT